MDQGEVTTALLQEYKDEEGKWPDEFNNKTYLLKDSKNRYWKTTLSIEKLLGVQDFALICSQKTEKLHFCDSKTCKLDEAEWRTTLSLC